MAKDTTGHENHAQRKISQSINEFSKRLFSFGRVSFT